MSFWRQAWKKWIHEKECELSKVYKLFREKRIKKVFTAVKKVKFGSLEK